MAKYVLNANAKYCKRTYVSTVSCEPTPAWNAASVSEEFSPCSVCDPAVEDQDWTVTTDEFGVCSATKIECIGPCDPECCPAYAGPDVFPDIPVPAYCCDTEDEQCLYKWDAEYLCNPSEGDPRWEVTGPAKTCVLPSDVTDKTAFDSQWAFEDGDGIRALDPLRDCTAVWYQLEATICEAAGDCPDLTEPELDENDNPVLDENDQPITGPLKIDPPAGDPSVVCCDGPWRCRRQWQCVYDSNSESWGAVTLVDFECANDCNDEPYGAGVSAGVWYGEGCSYYYWSCDVVDCDPHSPASQCSPGTAPSVPGFTPDPCECDSDFDSYTCTGSGDDCDSKTRQPDFDSYTCTGSGDDCSNPTRQSEYDSVGATGPGIGTFTFNEQIDLVTNPLRLWFALLTCFPKRISIAVRWKESAGSGSTFTLSLVALSNTNHFSSYLNDITSLGSGPSAGDRYIVDVQVTWETSAPSASYQLKGKAEKL